MNKEWCGIIQKKEDGSEKINYNDESYPAYIHDGYIRASSTWGNVAHYHTDLEFISVYDGHMGMNINGNIIPLKEGDTIMVNSGQIHFSFTDQIDKCKYALAILHPHILCSSVSVEENYVAPIINNQSLPFLLFKHGEKLSKEISDTTFRMIDAIGNHFIITKEFYNLWGFVLSYCNDIISTDTSIHTDQATFCMKKMITYCQNNYEGDIRLSDIAEYAGVSNTYCNQLFHRFANQTPIETLMRIRTEHAADLLLNSNLTMSEIAEKTGFSSASYFAEIFKRNYHTSPRAYKKDMLEERKKTLLKRA